MQTVGKPHQAADYHRGDDMTQSARRIASAVADVPLRQAANDNNPDRVTRMTPYNGGCSTLSGMVPVSVARVSMLSERVAA